MWDSAIAFTRIPSGQEIPSPRHACGGSKLGVVGDSVLTPTPTALLLTRPVRGLGELRESASLVRDVGQDGGHAKPLAGMREGRTVFA